MATWHGTGRGSSREPTAESLLAPADEAVARPGGPPRGPGLRRSRRARKARASRRRLPSSVSVTWPLVRRRSAAPSAGEPFAGRSSCSRATTQPRRSGASRRKTRASRCWSTSTPISSSPFSEELAAAAAEAFRTLGSPRKRAADVTIGITAAAAGAVLLSRNAKDFAGIPGLVVEAVA